MDGHAPVPPIEALEGYEVHRVIGSGSFGTVYQASRKGETLAIKKVFQDRRYKNRELQVMQGLHHPNIVELKNAFYTETSSSSSSGGQYLHLVMDYLPDTLYRLLKQHARQPLSTVRTYIAQLFSGLAYVHSKGIAHRDIKPHNLLIDPATGRLKLCDFGSAKKLILGEPNVAYICSRYYRAPELIFGSTQYTTAIDQWSAGCVMAELLMGRPIFPGQSGLDQIVEIIKVLGTPNKSQLAAMSPGAEFSFPAVALQPWEKVLEGTGSPEAIDLLKALLQYDPMSRLRAEQAEKHTFFVLPLPTQFST